MSTRHRVDWFVPVRSVGAAATLQTGRLPDGPRVGIAFTTVELLRAATGARQEWLRMDEDTLHEVLAPLGITRIQLDPLLVGPAVGPGPQQAEDAPQRLARPPEDTERCGGRPGRQEHRVVV